MVIIIYSRFTNIFSIICTYGTQKKASNHCSWRASNKETDHTS